MKTNPAISVIIPNYNYSHYLGECMQSVIDQTFIDWEMIVVDDGSTDNSREVVGDFIKRYPDKRIKYIYKEDGPSGTQAAVNLGIKNMQGEYFAWLSSDDVYMPEKLDVQFKYMEENPEVALTHTHFFVINGEGSITGKGGTTYLDYDQIVFDLLKGCNINGNTVLIRKEIFERLGLFRENDEEYDNEYPEICRATEYEKWVEIAMNFKISVIPQCLHKNRVHDANTPYNEINSEAARVVAKRIIEKSKIEDIFPVLKKFPQDQIPYLNSLLELTHLCHQNNWFDLTIKYLKEIGKINEKFYKSLPRDVVGLSCTELEFMKAILLGMKRCFNIDLTSRMRGFSELGIQEGLLLLQKGDYTKGRKVFEEWYGVDPESIKINYSLGSCYQKEGEFSKAIERFKQVLSLKMDEKEVYVAGAYFHLGEIYQNMGRLDEARIKFKKCLEHNPNHHRAKEILETLIL